MAFCINRGLSWLAQMSHFIVDQVARPSPYFLCDHSEGLVLPSQRLALVVRYLPKALGKHKATIPVKVTLQSVRLGWRANSMTRSNMG